MVTTFDGTTERVYINGVLEKSATMTPAIPNSASNRVVLGAPWNAAENMNADVGVVLMYNRTLSASEAQQIFTTYVTRFSITNAYIGCYLDASSRAFSYVLSSTYVSPSYCAQQAASLGYLFYGLQNVVSGVVECWMGDDLGNIVKYGVSTGCTQDPSSGLTVGGDWINAVYSVSGSYPAFTVTTTPLGT